VLNISVRATAPLCAEHISCVLRELVAGTEAVLPLANRDRAGDAEAGGAAAADVQSLTDQENTTAAVASWRAWRFVQVRSRCVTRRLGAASASNDKM